MSQQQEHNTQSALRLDRYVSYDEAAEYLGVSKATIIRLVNNDIIDVVYVTPSTPRVKLDALLDALKERSR